MKAVAVLLVLFLAGCTVSRTGTPVAASDPTTTTTTEPVPTAQDGADYQACADGTCEIEISDAVTIPLPGGSLVVSAVLSDGIEFDLTSAAGGGNGSLRGNCTAMFGGGGGGMSCSSLDGPPDPPTPRPGLIQLQIVGVYDDAAIIRIVS